MEQEKIIKAFAQLGKLMRDLGEDKPWDGYSSGVTRSEYETLKEVMARQVAYNGWFTLSNVRKSMLAIGSLLTVENLTTWAKNYSYTENGKTVAVIMAGNIPLVGFHDFLSVLISGNHVVAKLSADDKTLLPVLTSHIIQFCPELKERITFTTGRIAHMDAVIATGSDNSLTYFQQYFGKYPHIFRRNRTSIAVLTGEETDNELKGLGEDIFSYFGLGCRNVSHLMIPADFELSRFFEAIFDHSEVVHNNKYGNNYDYNKAVYLLNQHALLDNNFVLLRESSELFSPLAMLHYQRYSSKKEVEAFINQHIDKIQVVVGREYLPIGSAQCPGLNDYADGVDVMKWLEELDQK